MSDKTISPNNRRAPLPCFDTLATIEEWTTPTYLNKAQTNDYLITTKFLQNYIGSTGTFNSYRRECERLLQWSWWVALKPLEDLKREDIEAFVYFCTRPPKAWIGFKKPPRFIDKEGQRIANPEWRPYVVTVSKANFKKVKKLDKDNYALSSGAVKEVLTILNSFFNYLNQEEYTHRNPVALLRQKSKFIQTQQGTRKIRRLSQQQWQTIIQATEKMALSDPGKGERSLFMISALYSMYLRISELGANQRWIPKMNDFQKDQDGLWWFTTVGKGNKERQIAVSDDMLITLRRWRTFLSLTPLPSPSDNSPLLPKIRSKDPLSDLSHIRDIVQGCFDRAIEELNQQGEKDEADSLMEATVHWLRHTGISDDVKIRPREHVRDDAGHSSSATTDQYIDIELKERHKSAKRKIIKKD